MRMPVLFCAAARGVSTPALADATTIAITIETLIRTSLFRENSN
jgi:hypothetical protein